LTVAMFESTGTPAASAIALTVSVPGPCEVIVHVRCPFASVLPPPPNSPTAGPLTTEHWTSPPLIGVPSASVSVAVSKAVPAWPPLVSAFCVCELGAKVTFGATQATVAMFENTAAPPESAYA
jgi:hypothetical protein